MRANLTADGRWVFTRDAENRLAAMQSLPSTPSASWLSLKFAYDYQGRRISKVVSNWTGSTWSLVSSNRFVYAGWNLIAEVGSGGSLVRSYVWGHDLSGSLQGAGGVGGLLQVNYYGAQTTNCFVAYDGNGNVTALVNASDGKAVAQYEYGPFGEVLRASGPMARLNPMGFSTKYQDAETDLLYYGYRFYNPSLGRWLSRDPIGNRGGLNLVSFVVNDPIHGIDRDGRFWAHLHGFATVTAGYFAGLNGSCIALLVAGNISTDLLPGVMDNHAYHYTRPIYGNKVWALIASRAVAEGLLARGCELARRGACKRGLWLLGMGLHVQQDYWSHVVDGQPVSYDPRAEKGQIDYPREDDPNHRDHARDFDLSSALVAAGESYGILLWAKHACLGCCCN